MLHDVVYSCPLAKVAHKKLKQLPRLVDRLRACVPVGPFRDALGGVKMSVAHAAAYPQWWAGFDDTFVDRLKRHSKHLEVRRAAAASSAPIAAPQPHAIRSTSRVKRRATSSST